VAKEEPLGGGEGETEGEGVGDGVGVGVGLGFAASAIESNPANTSVVANNDFTGLIIGFIPIESQRFASRTAPEK
jgi:hypothetical protein